MFNIAKSDSERAFLVGLTLPGESPAIAEQNLWELERLCYTAGGCVVGQESIRLRAINTTTFIGKGNAERIALIAKELETDTVIFDEDLSPAQTRNLEDIFEMKILDRTSLILDIFAQKAHSHEGKLQIELAQLQYMLPRLKGMGLELSRLGGGIGTRGPGETKLETDRRRILNRISYLKKEIKHIEQIRTTQRKLRQKKQTPVLSLIGYTNAGKSTLLNALTKSKVLVEDKLFSTLDPTAKKLILPDGTEAVLIDTVGFIRKLPHMLVAAFRATLEEIKFADVLLLTLDASSQFRDEELKSSYEVLDLLEIKDKKILTIFNKTDAVEDSALLNIQLEKHKPSVKISALNGDGFERLFEEIKKLLDETTLLKKYRIPYSRFDLLAKVQSLSEQVELNYLDDHTEITVRIDVKSVGEVERDKDISIL